MFYARTLAVAVLAVALACGTEGGAAPERAEEAPESSAQPEPPPDAPAEPSPFPSEWMDAATWARLSPIEARERALAEASCTARSEEDELAREPLFRASEACAAAAERDPSRWPAEAHDLVFVREQGSLTPTRPRPLDDAPASHELEPMSAVRAACAPFIAALRESSLSGSACFSAPPLRSALPWARAGQGVSVEAWALAQGGDVAGGARLLARAIELGALLSRTRDGVPSAGMMLGSQERWIALLRAWEGALDASDRRELAATFARAAGVLRSPRELARAGLIDFVDRARAASDPARPWEGATGYEAAVLTLAALDDGPDAGLDARQRDVQERMRASMDAMMALDRRRQAPLPSDRAFLVLSGERTLAGAMGGAVRSHEEAASRLRELAASWAE